MTRWISGWPSNRTSCFGAPKRLEAPAARTIACRVARLRLLISISGSWGAIVAWAEIAVKCAQFREVTLTWRPVVLRFPACHGAGIAQLVERNLAKVEVASSSLVSRSKVKYRNSPFGCVGLKGFF